MSGFKLSDPGSAIALDPTISEYLRSYDFPLPPQVRYGFARIRAPQERHQVQLFAQAWVPGHAVGTVAIFHGYSEHSGNYARLIQELVASQLAVIVMDLRGHGLSEGPKGHAQMPNLYAEDAEQVLHEIFPQVLPNRPLFLWGHSMGAMTVLQLLLRGKLPTAPSAAVVTSPLLGFPELYGLQKILASVSPFLAKISPALPVAHGVPPTNLSHDEQYLAIRSKDPLILKVTTPRWFEAMKLAVKDLQKNAEKFQNFCPVLLMLAGDERITNLSSARSFAFRAFSGQKHKVIEFPGMFHELEKEPSVRARVVSESIAWFKSRL